MSEPAASPPATRAGQVVTVFRSRLRPDAGSDYDEVAQRTLELARTLPGFVDFKTFVADDGERVSVVTFADQDAQRAWRDHPEHRAAQLLGRARFYQSYAIQVCEVVGESLFTATP